MFASWCFWCLGTIQAAEALKYIIGKGDLLTNRLLIFDALKMNFRTVKVKPNPERLKIDKLVDFEQAACDLPNKG